MSVFRDPVGKFTFETLIGFVGALIVLPLLVRLVFGTIKTLLRLRFVRKLLVGAALTGLVSLLQNQRVLDRLFGPKGGSEGLLKTNP